MALALFDLADRVALVTGSSAGLGLTIARGLARAGARVVLNGRDEAKLAAASGALEREGLVVSRSAFDITDTGAVEAAVERIERETGPGRILVNNAGIQDRMPMVEMTDEAWQRVLDTNLTGAFKVARAVARSMLARRRGKIVNVCSLMSEIHRPTIANYSASKGGLKMLTRAMAVEWGPQGLQANGIGPGYFATDLTRPLVEDPEFNAMICTRTPAGRWGDPEDLVGTAIFLSSDASDYVNGQVLYVDGGLLAGL
jgi:gluconate 5-dehydrogenase